MRTRLSLAALLLACCGGAHASGTIDLVGSTYEVDTLFHNVVGPGTTLTSLWLHNGTVNLRVFYSIIDQSNPHITLECITAGDHLSQAQTLEAMSRDHTSEGHQAFLGINGDFFLNSESTTMRGVSMYGAPLGSAMSDGLVMSTRPNPGDYISFVADVAGQPHIGAFDYSGTLTASDGRTATVSAINPIVDPRNNSITLYNDLYFGSSNASGGAEVTARLADGETFHPSGINTLIITSEPDTDGDMLIPDGGYVLHARGTEAEHFVEALHTGDQITLQSQCTVGGIAIDPAQVVSGYPRILGDGNVLDTEWQRGDAPDRHPRTGIGYSDGGQKVYFCVVDGRSTISAGVRTRDLASILQYAGATEGLNLDGGGSSTFYSTTFGAVNVPSDGNLRAVANAVFAISSAPTDNTIAELRFHDFKLSVPRYGTYEPHFFGYNKHGMLIDTDVQGVKLSCSSTLGTVDGDTLFIATGLGTGLLTATLGDVSVSMPLTIVGDALDNMQFMHHSIVNDGLRDYTVEAMTLLEGNPMPISARALTWSSSDASVVAIDEHSGVLRGVGNGTATISGTIDGLTDQLLVTVERPAAHTMCVDDLDASTWEITMRCGTDGTATQLASGGFAWEYTGASGRLPRILLEKTLQLWSMPDTVRLRINAGNTPIKQVLLNMYAGEGRLTTNAIVPESVTPGSDLVLDLPTAAWTNTSDVGSFPLTLASIQVDLNALTAGENYHIAIEALQTIYDRIPRCDITADGTVDSDDLNAIINMMLFKSPIAEAADFNNNGRIDIDDINAILNTLLHK